MRRVRIRNGRMNPRNENEYVPPGYAFPYSGYAFPDSRPDTSGSSVKLSLNKLLNEYSSPTGSKIDEELIMSINKEFDRHFNVTYISDHIMRRLINSLDLTSDSDGQIEEFIWNSLILAFKDQKNKYSVKATPLTGFSGLVEIWLSASSERRLQIFQRLYTLFKSDPEINPNWKYHYPYGSSKIKKYSQNILIYSPNSGELLDLVNSCGSFDDLVFLIKRPGFVFPNEPIIIRFHEALTSSQITELVEILKPKVCHDTFKIELNTFGFRPEPFAEFEWSITPTEDAVHFREPTISHHNLGPRCHGCQEITKRSEFRFKGPGLDARKLLTSKCKCQFHVECALNLVCSFVNQILHPNPLERNIMRCPGCQGEIRVSFIVSVVNHLIQLDDLLDIVDQLPNDFLKNYRQEIKSLLTIDLNKLNTAIFIINHQKDPKFVACPKSNCQGFALIEPDQEVNTECLVCGAKSLFIGSQRQKEITKESSDVAQLLKNTDTIRPCTKCGKLIEKTEGCNSMNCSFCRSHFDWGRALQVATNHPELVIHF